MKYAHLSNAELIRYVDNLPSATSLERALAERLNALHERAVHATENGTPLFKKLRNRNASVDLV